MPPTAKKRAVLIGFLLLTVLLGLPAAWTYRQVGQERRNRALIAAIQQNDTAAAQIALQAGADPNARDKGQAPVSARQVLRDWLSRLRGHSATPEPFHPPALIVAMGDESSVFAGNNAATDTFIVLPPENLPLIQTLLEHGANPNARDHSGDTALMLAVDHLYDATARLLLDHGADINARNSLGETPLTWASRYIGNSNTRPLLDLLLRRGADIHVRDKNGNTALMIACVAGTGRDAIQRLLQAGADVNAQNSEGETALLFAVEDNTKVLPLLLDAGADVNHRDKSGDTPLLLEARQKNPDLIRLLLQKGADVTVKDRHGATPLTWAERLGDKETIRLLRQAGARD